MAEVRVATLQDLEDIAGMDALVMGDRSREEKLRKAIQENRCLLAQREGRAAGFLVYHQHFFEQAFMDLVIVHPAMRRQGVARALMEYMERCCLTEKLFSSTNQSNEEMQQVFRSLQYVESGYVDHLDEGDPELVFFKTAGRREYA
ncbi:GNAT family N-acetyltransferase [Ectobacillus ponti]|uniref:GNAT family N-acetyltransferase n=1 Tax=Ectobacillus ponti TaxID=2961894 RepID=A0AA41XC92_9BACI|nr:GNAT family N-acetyltransferase [Ectobacillus ponti]MCP8971028.1 GNAT family N-acetyltransferase [Ectobacillus ponti]